ncbi:MAG: HsdR family type I site-specific deoxyribonuclease [Anaerolineales bacterium]|nr:HsdR family type I site-specific deoxyribonuclease [Anaerolineales bacterium]
MNAPIYVEEISSHIPALHLLTSLGYTYLPPDEALVLRGGKLSQVILEPVLRDWLQAYNRAFYKGQEYPFTDQNIQMAINRLRDEPNDGLLSTNARLYDLLTLGTSLQQTIQGDKRSYTLQYIDWQNPANNVYHVSDEFSVERVGSHQTRRPDIVCFINGIPLAVIECKRPDLHSGAESPVVEAISQMVRNQKAEEIPGLFVFSQLLLAVSKNDALYATTGTPRKFWAIWREANPIDGSPLDETLLDQAIAPLINCPLSELEKQHLYDWRPYAYQIRREFDQIAAGGGRLPTVQDRAIYSLMRPERLLDIIYQFIVFDGGVKKIARYQQYFAVKATIQRVAHLNHQHTRTGGVIWHTTGSGKSLTMVMLGKALALHPNIPNPKVIIVTDRVNLDEQIWGTFHSCGKSVARADDGEDLVNLIQHSRADVITTVINKFDTAVRHKVRDENINIFVLVDESHRSQYGSFHAHMQKVFPKACYIGFTGTPLLKKEKTTAEKFGGFIHKYSMRQAVADEAVVPLLYEGRIVEMEVDQQQIDRWFERITRDLTEEQKVDLKRKFSRSEAISRAERRVAEIAYDISRHYRQNFQGTGFKAQLAAPSKAIALRYKAHLAEWGEVETAVLISPPDSREGHEEVDEAQEPALQAFWKKMMQQYGSEEAYNREIKASFAQADGLEILIVVDKLLTGFDEPRNRVLYIDKPLKEHSLLQAIARVNRLYEGKDHGLIVDYRGVLGQLNEAMQVYNALEAFDAADVQGAVNDAAAEVAKLPHYHNTLWDVFKTVPNRHDTEQMEQFLAPEDIRQRFYDALNNFAGALKTALGTLLFYEETPEQTIQRYKKDLAFFHNLRTAVRHRYAETIDYKEYEDKVRKLVDTHLQAEGVTTLTAPVNIFDVEAFDAEIARRQGAAAKADTIAYRMKRTITERMDEDPAFFRRFSQMIEETLKAYREGRISEVEYYQTMQQGLGEMRSGQTADLPPQLHRFKDAPAYYGVIKEPLTTYHIEPEQAATIAIQLEGIIEARKVRDWVGNSDVENRIRDDIEDYLYLLRDELGIPLNGADMDEIMDMVIDVARHRDRVYG